MNYLGCIISIVTLFAFQNTFAQTDTLPEKKAEVNFSGFVDAYYAYDLNEPRVGFRQPFLYNHNRHNEFNLNLGLIKAEVSHSRYRGNLALQAGTYAIDNYAAEAPVMRHVFEANAGVALTRESNLWLDAGIFGSHLGFESAVSTENWTLTRSLLAESSPYFLSGAKLTWSLGENWEMAAIICNGWQRIRRVPASSLPSFGTQLIYSEEGKFTLNWSTFAGTDDPDFIRRMRYFNNMYGQFFLTERLGLIAGFDIGVQEQSKGSEHYEVWFTPIVIARYKLTEKFATAVRAEYYQDENGVIIPTNTPSGFKTSGFSWNFDYIPASGVMCRIESRWFNSADEIFETPDTFSGDNLVLVGSIAVSF